jgi:hypothetical protein
MLSEVLDRWEILVELHRQQASWQQRWDKAQIAFEQSLQAIPSRDAERLRRVLEESLPRTTIAPVAKSAQHPSTGSEAKAIAPETLPAPANSANNGPQISQEILANEEPVATKRSSTKSSPGTDTNSVAAFDDPSKMADDQPESDIAEVQSEQVSLPADASTTDPAPLEVPEVTLEELLNWAAEIIGDGVPENILFQELRKSKYSSHARQLFEALKERDAFYETDDEVIRVHSLRQVTV